MERGPSRETPNRIGKSRTLMTLGLFGLLAGCKADPTVEALEKLNGQERTERAECETSKTQDGVRVCLRAVLEGKLVSIDKKRKGVCEEIDGDFMKRNRCNSGFLAARMRAERELRKLNRVDRQLLSHNGVHNDQGDR